MPEIKGSKGLSSARKAARSKMSRYVHVLLLFSGLEGGSLNWSGFDFKAEYSELTRKGLIKGNIGNVVDPETLQGTGEQILTDPIITVEGVDKIAELTEFLWRTSLLGKITTALVQLLWLIAGVVIGHILST